MEKIKWIVFGVIVIGFMAFIIISSNETKLDISNVNASEIQIANEQNGSISDNTYGNIDSKVILIEYADYQCPGCGSINPLIKLLVEDYKEQIGYVFRNYPIPSLHPNAKSSAAAAESAGLQDNFWEMHHMIFETQSEWSNLDASERTDYYAKIADKIGLDSTKLISDMASKAVDSKIKYDQALGLKSGIEATPTFYLNGEQLDDTIWGDMELLRGVINDELTKNNITLPEINDN